MTELENLKKQIYSASYNVGISSDEVGFAKSVVDNKNKDKSLFVCEGLWAVEKLIEKNIPVTYFFFSEDAINSDKTRLEDLQKIAKMTEFSEKNYAISEKSCKKISDRDGFDKFFIIAKMPTYTLSDLTNMFKANYNVMAIVMDGLEQPGNIGAILRSFDAAGGDFAIITNKQARLTNSRLIRSSLGAAFMMPVVEAEINEVQDWLVKNNFKSIVTDLHTTESYKDADYSGRIAIISGNEHTGISDSWRHITGSKSIIIPMLGSVESLNVGFASTLVAYEAGLKKFGNKK